MRKTDFLKEILTLIAHGNVFLITGSVSRTVLPSLALKFGNSILKSSFTSVCITYHFLSFFPKQFFCGFYKESLLVSCSVQSLWSKLSSNKRKCFRICLRYFDLLNKVFLKFGFWIINTKICTWPYIYCFIC